MTQIVSLCKPSWPASTQRRGGLHTQKQVILFVDERKQRSARDRASDSSANLRSDTAKVEGTGPGEHPALCRLRQATVPVLFSLQTLRQPAVRVLFCLQTLRQPAAPLFEIFAAGLEVLFLPEEELQSLQGGQGTWRVNQ